VVNDLGPSGQYATSYAATPDGLGLKSLALPDIFFRAAGWGSEIVVQNTGATTANITIVYTKTNAPLTTTNWVDNAVPELGSGRAVYLDPSRAGVPDRFVGIATVRADQPVIATVRSASFDLGAVHPRKAYVYRVPLPESDSGSGRSLYFPLLVNEFEEWDRSEIQIMNAGPAGRSFSLQIGAASSSQFIPGWSVGSYPQNQVDTQSPPGDPVPGRVQNAVSLHSLVWLNGEGGFVADSLAAYSTPSAGGRTYYLPFADQAEILSTYVAVQNLGGAPANVTLSYHSVTGTLASSTETLAVSDMALYEDTVGLPPGFRGGIVVQADQPVSAVALIGTRLVLHLEVFLPITLRK
jgi:hypothetical protein